MIHHSARPDIFKGPATKYNDDELRAILKNEATPVFICTDENDIPLGHAFCMLVFIYFRLKFDSTPECFLNPTLSRALIAFIE